MLGGPEFQRRLVAALEQELIEHTKNVILAKDWSDFCERRGQVKAFRRVIETANDIIKKWESI